MSTPAEQPEKKIYKTAMEDVIRIIQEFNFHTMNEDTKQKWFQHFLMMERNHTRWAFGHAFFEGKLDKPFDFNTYWNANHYKLNEDGKPAEDSNRMVD
jgi:hypothetical protein